MSRSRRRPRHRRFNLLLTPSAVWLCLPNQIWQTKGANGKEAVAMTRPAAKDLTQRELEVMHIFWNAGALTAAEVRDRLAATRRVLTYTTVANLVRILH